VCERKSFVFYSTSSGDEINEINEYLVGRRSMVCLSYSKIKVFRDPKIIHTFSNQVIRVNKMVRIAFAIRAMITIRAERDDADRLFFVTILSSIARAAKYRGGKV
jgi:hypothetical protein